VYRFNKLEIYKLSRELIKENYKLTRKFPKLESYSLVQQMNRSSVSIASNIAEGTARNGNKDKKHFINISYSSLMELVCQLEVSYDLGYISETELKSILTKTKNLVVKLNNFSNSIKC
jgi:four helix bundle protein